MKRYYFTDRQILVIAISSIVTLLIYFRYYDQLVFHPQPIIPLPSPSEGSRFGISIPGYEGHLIMFLLLHGGPFLFLAAYLKKSWDMRKACVLSGTIWMLVFFYSVFFRSDEFSKLHLDGYQCVITAISTYPLMAISLFLGHCFGKVSAILIFNKESS